MRIYDTIIFDNELTLLEHRLRESVDLVDVFVIVEAAETFQGRSKSLNFQENKERFAWAKEKLRHVALPRLPGQITWEREAFQRNAIQLGLYDAQPDDIVLILDADEIPSRSVLQQLRENGLHRPHRLLMTRHYGHIDTLAPRSACCVNPDDPFPFAVPHLYPGSWDNLDPTWWCMPGVAVRLNDISGNTGNALAPRTPNSLRRENQFAPRLPDAGRHFSSISVAEDLRIKLSHFSHAEYADERSLASLHLRRTRHAIVHPRGWWYAERPEGPVPADLVRLEGILEAEEKHSVPGEQKRRMVRTWAWIRHWPRTPKTLVQVVDRYFERMGLILFPLLVIDQVRSAIAWLKLRKHSTGETTAH